MIPSKSKLKALDLGGSRLAGLGDSLLGSRSVVGKRKVVACDDSPVWGGPAGEDKVP